VVLPLAEKLLDEARRMKLVERADLAGSIRRGRETIGDIDLLISSRNGEEALREFVKLPMVKRASALGETRASALIEGNLQVDVRAEPKESYGAALQYLTGSKQHSVHLRTIAQRQGLKVNEYGVFRGDKRIGDEKEDDIYRALGRRRQARPRIHCDHGSFSVVAHRERAGHIPAAAEDRRGRGAAEEERPAQTAHPDGSRGGHPP
jgi:DNA polymerase (family 10)